MKDYKKAKCQVGQTFRELIDDDVPMDDDHILVDTYMEIDFYHEDSDTGYLCPNVDDGDV